VTTGLYALAIGSYLCQPLYTAVFFADLVEADALLAAFEFPLVANWILGAPTYYPSDWLWSLLLHGVESWQGERGLVILKLLLSVAAFLSLLKLFVHLSRELFFSGILATIATATLLSEAPLHASLIGISLAALCFERTFVLRRSPETRVLDLQLVILFILFSSLSDLAPATLLVCLPIIWLSGGHSLKCRVLRVLSVGATIFVHPAFGLQFVQTIEGAFIKLQLIAAGFEDVSSILHYPFALFLLLLFLFFTMLAVSRKPLPAHWILLLVIANVIAFLSTSWLVIPTIIASAAAADLVRQAGLEKVGRIGEGVKRLQKACASIPAAGVSWILLCLVIVNTYRLWQRPALVPTLGSEVVAGLRAEETGVFSSTELAGIVEGTLRDSLRDRKFTIVTDKNFEFISLTRALTVYRVERGLAGWHDQLIEQGVRWVLCEPSAVLCELLRLEPRWELVAESRMANLYRYKEQAS